MKWEKPIQSVMAFKEADKLSELLEEEITVDDLVRLCRNIEDIINESEHELRDVIKVELETLGVMDTSLETPAEEILEEIVIRALKKGYYIRN